MLTFPEINTDVGIRSELDNLGYPGVLAYLRARGIEGQLIDDLGLRILPASEVMSRARGSRTLDDRLAVVFPHFNVKGDYIDWWSARLVDTGLRPAIVSFANLAPGKRGKMFCPPQEAPHAYLVPTLDWSKLGRGDRVYIHESCVKAIAGARLGYWSVGLNGVWGWTSRKHGVALVQELKDLPWKALGLEPVIVFDSNAVDNWDVRAAISRLAAKILEITGRRATHLLLPMGESGAHWGFDDYVCSLGDEAGKGFLDGVGGEVEISELEMLKLQLNEEVCVVRSLGRIAHQEKGTLMTRAVFTDVNYAHFMAMVEVGEREVVMNVPKLWLADGRRLEVEGLTYAPGGERISDGDLNLWRGMGLEPRRGDVSIWLELLESNVPDLELRKWMIAWFAYPLQNLGRKMTSFVHLFGPPGTGKQAILAPLMRIYGDNACVIGRREITSDFNSIYANKQFINLDELHGGGEKDGVTIANKIKMLTTGEHLTVNTKGQPEYKVPNVCNLVTSSNYSDSIRLDDDDRRCAVVRFGVRGEQWKRERWEEFWGWALGDGAEALLDYLLNVDISWFDPNGWAPLTEDKKEVTSATRRPDEQWVAALWEDPDSAINPKIYAGALCLFTGAQLAEQCYAGDPQGVTVGRINSLGKKLYDVGLRKIELKVGHKKERFWVVRKRDDEWGTKEARHHLKVHGYPGL